MITTEIVPAKLRAPNLLTAYLADVMSLFITRIGTTLVSLGSDKSNMHPTVRIGTLGVSTPQTLRNGARGELTPQLTGVIG